LGERDGLGTGVADLMLRRRLVSQPRDTAADVEHEPRFLER